MLIPAANRSRMKRQRRQRQVAAVRPARASDAVWVREAVVNQEARAVGDIIDGGEPVFLVVGVHECPPKSTRAADIRRKHSDSVIDQPGEKMSL